MEAARPPTTAVPMHAGCHPKAFLLLAPEGATSPSFPTDISRTHGSEFPVSLQMSHMFMYYGIKNVNELIIELGGLYFSLTVAFFQGEWGECWQLLQLCRRFDYFLLLQIFQ